MRYFTWTLTVGGGEVLDYIGKNDDKKTFISMDEQLIKQLNALPYVKYLIFFLVILGSLLLIAKIFDIRSPFNGRAIRIELGHLDKIRRRDDDIIRANKFINNITNIVENSPLAMNKTAVDYMEYNLTRANIKIPGGARVIKPQEFNAIIITAEFWLTILGLFIMVFISAPLGAMLILTSIGFGSTVPIMYVRSLVKMKDSEILANFSDMYLMVHYVLLAGAGTSLVSVLKSFDKTTTSEEMHRYVDICTHYFDTYGEYQGTNFISKQYREIAQVGKLMRLIRQANDGGDVRAELINFRNEVLSAKKYAIKKRMEALVLKARMSFNILMILLIQAIISAMAIYFKDISITSSFM